MTDLYLCWCPRAIEDHHNGECPTRTAWLDIEDSEWGPEAPGYGPVP